MSKQVESHAKWLATLAGRQDPPWQPIVKSILTERGRGSAPGSSGNEMTGRVRHQGLGRSADGLMRPRTAAYGSVNGIEWTLGEICRAAPWRSFFLNECMQICVGGFSWHLPFSSSTRSGEFLIMIINQCSIRTQSVFSNGSLSRSICPSLFVPCASSSFKHVSSRCSSQWGFFTTFLFFLIFSESLFLHSVLAAL